MTNNGTTILKILAAMSLFLSGALYAGEDMSAEQWYRDSYAPLWIEPTEANMKAAASHYAPSLSYHIADGEMMVVNSGDWIGEAVVGWKADGWVRSEMTELSAHEINASTYTITAKWRDEESGGEVGFSCGWYIVGRTEDGWRITNYADSACEE